jgi:hypothetical protein
MRLRAVACASGLGGLLALAALQACGLGVNGTDELAPDAASKDGTVEDVVVRDGGDARSDTGAPDGCSGVTCNGQCMAAPDCQSCPGATLLCGPTKTCMADCAACRDSMNAGLPIQCFACDQNHRNPLGTCQYDDAGAYCLNGFYGGQYVGGADGFRCACDDGGCPGMTQVCAPLGTFDAGSFCLTCGETTAATIDGQPCTGGGTCHADQHKCQ